MNLERLGVALVFASLFVSGSALADAFTYTVTADSEMKVRNEARREGRDLCQAAGYRFADVEIVHIWMGGEGYSFEAYAIATCFDPI